MDARGSMDQENTKNGTKVAAGVSAFGAVGAAFAAAACCVGPLIVAMLGVGGAGAMVALAPYRLYFLAGTAVLLGVGFFLVYRKRPAAAKAENTGDACGCDAPAPKRKRDLAKWMLWGATALVVLFAASPYLLSATAGAADSEAVRPDGAAPVAQVALTRVEIPVQGMDCVSCGVAIRRAMDSVGGYRDFELDLDRQTVSFRFEGDGSQAARFARSIREIGYEVGEPRVL